MISMSYNLAKLAISTLLRRGWLFDAFSSLSRLDERIARSLVGEGFVERSHFVDACATLWIDCELVHLEDLVLHDATKDTHWMPLPAAPSNRETESRLATALNGSDNVASYKERKREILAGR